MKQLDVRRDRLAALKRLNQREWRCTSRSDKYAMARLDDLDGRWSLFEICSRDDPMPRISASSNTVSHKKRRLLRTL